MLRNAVIIPEFKMPRNICFSDNLTMVKMTIEQKTIGGVKWSGISQFMRIGTQAITSVILARLLFPEDFGLLGMALIFTGLVAIFNDLGIGSAILKKKTGWCDQ